MEDRELQTDEVAWDLNGCCGTEEIIFLAFYGAYAVAFFFLYDATILKPMRLLAVYVTSSFFSIKRLSDYLFQFRP